MKCTGVFLSLVGSLTETENPIYMHEVFEKPFLRLVLDTDQKWRLFEFDHKPLLSIREQLVLSNKKSSRDFVKKTLQLLYTTNQYTYDYLLFQGRVFLPVGSCFVGRCLHCCLRCRKQCQLRGRRFYARRNSESQNAFLPACSFTC